MSIDTWLMFSLAALLIAISPGSMAVLSMNHGIHFGKSRSLATACGSGTAAMILMMASIAGLGTLLNATEYGFIILKYCGAAYLVFLGLKLLRTKAKTQNFNLINEKTTNGSTSKNLFKQAFMVGISNPQDLLFFSALFPQFINIADPLGPQFAILATTWIVLDFSFVMVYACMANVLAPSLITSNKLHWFDMFSGGVLIALAILLLIKNT